VQQQRSFNRLAWNNLSTQAKIVIIVIMMLLLTGLTAAVTGAIIGSFGQQTREGLADTLEMRSLAQDIQLKIEELQRLETRLVEDYASTGVAVDPDSITLDDEFQRTLEEIRGTNLALARLRELTLSLATSEEIPALDSEFRSLEGALLDSEQNFNATFTVVTNLTSNEGGALARLNATGTQLQTLTAEHGDPELDSQLVLVRNLESSLVRTGTAQTQADLRTAVENFRTLYQINVPLNRNAEIVAGIDTYLALVDEVSNLIGQVDASHRTTLRSLEFARGSSSRLANIAVTQADRQVGQIEALTSTATQPLLYGAILQVLALAALMFFFGRTITTNLNRLLEATRLFERGNLTARVATSGQDEFSQLGRGFNTMAGQLAELVGSLEARVAERTRDLTITAEIGQAVLAVRDPRELLQEVVDTIRDRFDFYHVQVFLVDEMRVNARLVASTGSVGRELLTRRHSLVVGSQSVIGQATATAQPVLALDTDTSQVHRRNELLPDTRSEMALPMRIGDQVIGALDVQSVAPNAFDADTIAVFQIMSDQLAVAVENARLQSNLQEAINQVNMLERQMTAESWRTYQANRDPNAAHGYELHGEVVMATRGEMPLVLTEAIRDGRLIAQEKSRGEIQIALPIRVRGEVIGAFGFGGETLRDLSEDDITLIESVIDRVGLALENMRLVDQTARRAEHEQLVNEITAKIVGSTDINYILQTTVKELGRALRAPETSVQLRRETMELRDE
jgi:GAF domain-containing protein/HAMP domain-containing protein